MQQAIIILVFISVAGYSCQSEVKRSHDNFTSEDSIAFTVAAKNSQLANEAFIRCSHYVEGWMKHADSLSGLFPRNLNEGKTYWNAQDAAADNYPFMVLTTAILNEELYHGTMKEILNTERQLTARVGNLPDVYSFVKRDFLHDSIDMDRIIFGASEYMKDGLLPVTEYLGSTAWSERLLELLDELDLHMDVKESFEGRITAIEEINGELLQVLCRMYWFTGNEDYLDRAILIGDCYLHGNRHPTRDLEVLRFRDHGCEIIAGLSELYFTVAFSRPDKREQYQPVIHQILDRILEIGRNKDGMFYNQVNPVTGEILNEGIADTWGYIFNAYLTVYQLDGNEEYLEAIHKAIRGLVENYNSFDWENGSSDGYADAIEGALNLLNRIPDQKLSEWIDNEIKVMWGKQQTDGIIEGWHGDGNFARTSLMYGLWKTAGLTMKPWEVNLKYGSLLNKDTLYIHISTSSDWEGTLYFDCQRHQEFLNLPFDYPRINQFPEWWTIKPDSPYILSDIQTGESQLITGKKLLEGFPLKAEKDKSILLLLSEKPPAK